MRCLNPVTRVEIAFDSALAVSMSDEYEGEGTEAAAAAAPGAQGSPTTPRAASKPNVHQ